jgi:PleD family two-component response regulator
MTVDSQRSASTVHADRGESRVNDTWLGPVLVAGGVLTPDQLAEGSAPPAPAPSREAARPSPSVPANPEPVGTEPLRILVADDDPQMRRLIKSVLQREGLEVVEAVDGLDALEAVERSRVDLVILDLEMPHLDGLGVLEELRAQIRTASLPVIVPTAQHGESEEKALDLGAQDYLTKPVQTRSLVARVRAVLKRVNS